MDPIKILVNFLTYYDSLRGSDTFQKNLGIKFFNYLK